MGDDDCEPGDLWEELGQMMMVGMISVLLSMIPGVIFRTMHARESMMFKREDSKEWRQTLEKWRARDRAIWIVGSCYCLFSAFFTVLFLANVTLKDQIEWAISVVIAVILQTVAIPLIVSIGRILCIAVAACHPAICDQSGSICASHSEQTASKNIFPDPKKHRRFPLT